MSIRLSGLRSPVYIDTREIENIESDYEDDSDDENMPAIPEGYLFDAESSAAIFACPDRYDLKNY